MKLAYETIYSARRTIGLTVKNGKLTVRAPYGTSDRKIRAIVETHRAWIEKSLARQAEKTSTTDDLPERVIAALRRRAKSILPKKAAYFSQIIGVNYGRITITGAKTRFGSCSSEGNLSFSYFLMLYPEEAWDYVVVHELCHRIEMNHSPAFYALVEAVLPDYKRRRKMLKEPPDPLPN